MHPLLTKKAMDPVNQELLKETDYPAADKDYVSPFCAKGTEVQQKQLDQADAPNLSHMARYRGSSKKAEIEMHTSPPKGSPNYSNRTYLDQDIKEEIHDEIHDEVYDDIKEAARKSPLLVRR